MRSVVFAMTSPHRALIKLREHGHVICRDAQDWLELTAQDTSPAVVALRQRLDWRTGDASTTCQTCGADVHWPIWIFTSRAALALVLDKSAPLRACHKHRRHDGDETQWYLPGLQ